MSSKTLTRHRQTGGFTMIELVVVIVLLGVLAATALPRFISVSTEARVSALESLKGSLASGAAMAKTKCRFVPGCDTAGWASAPITSPDGLTGNMYNGYPTSNASSTASHITRWVSVDGFSVNTSSVLFTDFSFDDATNPAGCRVRYNYSIAQNQPPSIDLTTTGC